MIEFQPIEPALFDVHEAAIYLLLSDNGENPEVGRRAINRLVDRGDLRPCLVGGKRRYSRRELDRFIQETTEKYGETE